MATTTGRTGSGRTRTDGGSWEIGRLLLLALVLGGTLAGGAPAASAKGDASEQGRERPTSSQLAGHGGEAMGISVPLPPPS